MYRNGKKKVIGIVIVLLCCVTAGIVWLTASKGDNNGRVISTAMFANSIADKFQNEDGYYLTVALDDSTVDYYHLSYDKASIKTDQKIYDKVSPGDQLAGISLRIAIPKRPSGVDPEAAAAIDMISAADLGSVGGLVFKLEQLELCEIEAVHMADNSSIYTSCYAS